MFVLVLPFQAEACGIRKGACVSLKDNTAWLVKSKKVVYGPVKITSGRSGYPTPIGYFRVWRKNRSQYSKKYKAPMPNSVFFNKDIAFHSGSLKFRSHGCIHLSRKDSKKFFEFLSIGEVVVVK